MGVLAIVPARAGSKGIPDKNFRPLAGGLSAVDLALRCARLAGIPSHDIYLSTDAGYPEEPPDPQIAFRILTRPPELAQDDTPMIAVIQDVLARVPGPPDQIIVLLQPTQPVRRPEHVRDAIQLLEETGADSVVSVVALPLAQSPDVLCEITPAGLVPWPGRGQVETFWSEHTIHRRQDARVAYQRDGTVYAFWRSNLDYEYSTIYGSRCVPLIIPASESCPLDTPDDWLDAERRLRDLS